MTTLNASILGIPESLSILFVEPARTRRGWLRSVTSPSAKLARCISLAPITGSARFENQRWLLWVTVIFRAALLGLLSLEYATVLFAGAGKSWQHASRKLFPLALSLLALAFAAALGMLAQRVTPAAQPPEVVTYIRSLSTSDQGLAASSRNTFYQVKPYFRDDAFLLVETDEEHSEERLRSRLAGFTAGKSQVWLLLDHGATDQVTRNRLESWFDGWGSKATNKWFGPWQLAGYLPYTGYSPQAGTPANVSFAGQLALVRYELSSTTLSAAGRFRLGLQWRVEQKPERDYKVFVHLLDRSGRIIAQSDAPLLRAGQGSAGWSPGEVLRQGYDISLPLEAAPGEHVLIVGLYDPTTGQRLPVTGESGAQDDKSVLRTLRIGRAGD